MIFPQTSGARRFSANVLLGVLVLILFDKGDHLFIFSSVIDRVFSVIPGFKKIFLNKDVTDPQAFYAAAFILLSWILGNMVIRFVEFQEFSSSYSMRICIKCLTTSKIKWNIFEYFLVKPLLMIPVRKEFFDDVSNSIIKTGFKSKNLIDWDDNDYSSCFEIALFINNKSKQQFNLIKTWDESANFMSSLGWILLTIGTVQLFEFDNYRAPNSIIVNIIVNIIISLLIIIPGCLCWRLSTYLRVRQVYQIFSWFILQSTKSKPTCSRKKNPEMRSVQAEIPEL